MTRTRFAAAALAVFAALAAGCANVDGDDHGDDDAAEQELPLAEIMAEATTPLSAAIATAVAARPGKALEAELEGEIDDGEREVVYEIMILGDDGKVYSAEVSPSTGDLLEVEAEDEAEEIEEILATAAALPEGHLSLTELIAAAEQHTGGTALAAEIEAEDDDGVECEVVLFADGKLIEAEMDLTTGRVLETEEADELDDDDDDDDREHDDD